MELKELQAELPKLYHEREQKIRELGIAEGAIQVVEFLINKQLTQPVIDAEVSEVKS